MNRATDGASAAHPAEGALFLPGPGVSAPVEGAVTTSLAFPATPSSAGRARAFVAAALEFWGVDKRVDELVLCASELASNALSHGSTPTGHFLLRVAYQPQRQIVRIEVHDRSENLPDTHERDLLDERGRGLLLVRRLSEQWGVEPRVGGKVVWTEIQINPSSTKGMAPC